MNWFIAGVVVGVAVAVMAETVEYGYSVV